MKSRACRENASPLATRAVVALLAVAVALVAGSSRTLRAQESRGASGANGDRVQYSVMIDGATAVVRPVSTDAPPEEAALFERGAVAGLWKLAAERVGLSAASNRRFSYSVAVSGDIAVVGAEWQDGFKGAAYVLRRDGDTWRVEQQLSPADLGRLDHFGSSVSINGDYVVVEAPWQDLFRGARYVFGRVNGVWVEQQKLTASDATPSQRSDAPEELGGNTILSIGILDVVSLVGREVGTAPARSMQAVPEPDSVWASDNTLENRVEVMWTGVGQDAIVYKVLRDGVLLSVVSSDETQYSDVTGVPGVTYNYCVVVKDMGGMESTPKCDTGSRIIFPPITVSASDGDYVGHVRITWVDMSSINTGYVVTRDGDSLGTAGPNGNYFEDDTATPETVYSYAVAAFDAGGYQSTVAGDNGWRGAILPPLEVTASDGQYLDRVRITWQPQGPDTLVYSVYRNDLLIATPGPTETSYDDTTVVFGETYTYCVARGQNSLTGIPTAAPEDIGPIPGESRRVCDEGGTQLAAPGNVAASDSTFDDRIQVTWDDLGDFEDGYEISRSDTAYVQTVVLDTTYANATLYNDFTALPDTPYIYTVRAVSDLGGVSADSSDVGYRSIVLAPTDVQATDGTFEDRVEIAWNSTSTTAVLFKIYCDGVFIKSVSVGNRVYSDYGGTSGQTYDYSVAAVTAMEAEATGLSDQGSRELKTPSVVSASDEEYEDKIVVSWTDNSRFDNGYVVYRENTVTTVVDTSYIGANRTSFTDYGSAPGVTYNYSVAAFDSANGTMGYSPPAEDLGSRVLFAPTDVQADKGLSETQVKITWRDNSDAEDGYHIYRDSLLIGTTPDNATSFVDSPDSLGQTSLYHIRAFDAYGESEAASDSGYTMILAPISFNASDFYEERCELTWIDQSDIEEGYEITRDGVLIATLTDPNATSYTDVHPLMMLTGNYDTPGTASDVVIAGDYAYVADGSSGFQIIDITDPANPQLAGSCDTPGNARDVAIAGGYAYVADDSHLRVINISNPAIPTVVGNYRVDGEGTAGVVVAGNSAYVRVDAGLEVVDITTPTSPTYVGRGNWLPGEHLPYEGIAIEGSYAFVPHNAFGLLLVFDISNPSSPQWRTVVAAPSNPVSVVVANDYAYVGGQTGINIYSIDDPSVPALLGSYPASDARDIAVAGDYAYVAAANSGLQVLDISDPAQPSLRSSTDTPGEALGVAVVGDIVCLADGSSGLQVLTPQVHSRTFDYCVRSYRGDVASATVCDNGIVPAVEHYETETLELFLKLLANDGEPYSLFGWSVSISDDRAIVGARWDHNGGIGTGSAYVFERTGDESWVLTDKLLASDGGIGDEFGRSVAISGDRAIVGADCKNSCTGAAYIFERVGETWVETQKLVASDPAPYDQFGYCVSMSGDRAIVGAPEKNSSTGAAYVFERVGDNWSVKKITASDPASTDFFGASVAISGERAIVGAYGGDGYVANSGSVYIFERDTVTAWPDIETQKITASDAASGDKFGWSVAISRDRAIVGACDNDDDGFHSGSAYIYERGFGGTWAESQKLVANDAAVDDWFGWSVAITENRAIVGANNYVDDGDQSGAAYLFERELNGTWVQTAKLLANDRSPADIFGNSVSISGDQAIVGAPVKNSYTGAAYVAELVIGPRAVAASDGTLKNQIRITWDDRSLNEQGFRVLRDGKPIATVEPNAEVYDDFDADPGQTYEYGVVAFNGNLSDEVVRDFGWRPANGSITGRISSIAGGAAAGISVGIEPLPLNALHLDGAGGYVSVRDTAGAFNLGAGSSFTIEAWVKYVENGGTGGGDGTVIVRAAPESGISRFPFLLSNMRGSGEPGRLRFAMSDSVATVSVSSDSSGFNDNVWHHVACVHDAAQDSMRLYVDGNLQGTAYASLGDVTNVESLTLGAGRTPGTWFGGQIDEVRIWSVARDAVEIRATMYEQLEGDEADLLGYWPLDRRGAGVITDITAGAHYGVFHGGVYWTDDSVPLDIFPVTDTQGNYIFNDLYYGTGATFEVKPFEGNRQFDPAYKVVSLSTESPVENQVNFTDISSFTVSGAIRYAGTGCAAADIPILVDSQPAGATDMKGKFAVSVDLGEHSIRPSLECHTFGPDSLVLFVDEDVSVNDSTGVAFTDSTTRTLAGRLGGGCGRPVGNITITIRSENDCLAETYAYAADSTSYSVLLPPQNYLVSAAVDPQTIPAGLSKSDVTKFFQNLGVRMAEMDSLDVTMDFVYRAPLKVAIKGFDQYVETCEGPLTFEERTLPDNLPVIPQLTELACTVQVYEDYGGGETCPLDSGTVFIYDEIFDRQNDPFEVVIQNGAAVCSTFASTPSLVVGRVDEQGNDRSFQKAINAVVTVEGRAPASATEWVLVTGHVAPEGADFVTATADVPLYILRDPPGDNSSAFLEEGHTSRTRIHWDKHILSGQAGVRIEGWFGADTKWFVGLGAGTIFKTKATKGFETELLFGNEHYEEWTTDLTFTTKKTFSTSTNDLFVGERGDVFVGAGYNFIFSEVSVIGIEDCEVTKSVSVGFQPDSVATVYAYAQQYIEDVLIPELASKVEYYQGLADAGESLRDSVAVFQARLEGWKDILAINDSLKTEAPPVNNRSFSAGADFTYFAEAGTTTTYTHKETFIMDGKGGPGGFGWENNFVGVAFWIFANVHHEDLGANDDTTGTASMAVGYTLSDDNIGDHFTVDIKNDGRYPSPVFDVRAGVSSCPYEPWPDSTGAPRMMSRDKPVLNIAPIRRDNVPPDEPAVFTLNITNLSPTGETRKCVLRELGTSNPYGAVLYANGVWLYDGLLYNIDPGVSQELTLAVERGPRRYKYENLALIVHSPCEWSVWDRGGPLNLADTLYFDVFFDAPCSDITLLLPESGWVYDKAMADQDSTIELLLTDYELDIGDDGGTILDVGVQYRRLGVGREGPGPWTECAVVANPDSGETLIAWLPPPTLEDGVYELRAYTHCQGGYGYSEVATGTIERHGPMVMGNPEPADGELSMGESISITFNELIDCESIPPDSVTLTYLDGPSQDSTVALETACDGRTIVVTPTASANDLEARRIQARVSAVRDRAGNPMPEPVTWEFVYRKSQFTWSQLVIAHDVAYRDPGVITGELVNGTGEPVEYTISPPPSWITSVVPSAGTILPGGRQTVSFAIQDDLDGGVYQCEVAATAVDPEQGVAVCEIYVTVSCHEPVWAFDPSRFEHTMTMVATLDIGGELSTDENDRVAAFVGGELRGVANVDSVAGLTNPNVAFLTIYSNRAQGETVRFQVWDADSCRLYNSTLRGRQFEANGSIGSANAPDTLFATEVLVSGSLEIAVNEGWTWVSTNIHSVDMSVTGVLSDLLPAEGDLIKSHTAFSQFVDDSTGWSGVLDEIDNVSSYMLKLSTPGTIIHTGDTVSTDSLVPVHQGWNWIGYLPRDTKPVSKALFDLQNKGLVSDGDVIKGQHAFAEYLNPTWYGSLAYMEPGKGYKLRLASDVDSAFTYPPTGSMAPVTLIATADESKGEPTVAEGAPAWSVNPHSFEHNMTVTAVLRIGGMESIDENDVIGAFVEDECRGVTSPVYVDGVRRFAVFLMVCSNEAGGERVTLRAFDADAAVIYDVAETLTFEADKVAGTVRSPVVFTATSVRHEGGEGLPSVFALSQNYPNPFNPTTVIGYDVPASGGHVTLRIYDVGGRLVRTLLDGPETPGRKTVTWDGSNNRGQIVATGVYFYRMTAPGFEMTRKMIMMK